MYLAVVMKYAFSLLLLLSSFLAQAQSPIDYHRIGTIPLIHTDTASEKLPAHEYFAVGIKYPESSVALLRNVRSQIDRSGKSFTGNGFITLHFTVDRNGKVFNYSLSETDRQYRHTTFSNDLVRILYDFTQSLDQWPVARLKDGTAVNYNYYLSFQIKDGTVVTVSP